MHNETFPILSFNYSTRLIVLEQDQGKTPLPLTQQIATLESLSTIRECWPFQFELFEHRESFLYGYYFSKVLVRETNMF